MFNAALTHASVVASGDEALTLFTFAPSLTTSLYPATLYTVKLCPARVLPSPAFKASVPSAANAAEPGTHNAANAATVAHTAEIFRLSMLDFSF